MEDGLWMELIRHLNAEIRAAVNLDRVYVSRDGEKLLARFQSTRLLDDEAFRALSSAIAAGFPGVRVAVRVSYAALETDVRKNIGKYAFFLSGILMKEFPGAMPYIVWEDADWRLDEGRMRLAVGDQIGAAYLRQQAVDQRISQHMKELFGIECTVQIDVRGDEETRIQAIQERRLREEEQLRHAVREAQQAAEKKKPAVPQQLIGHAIPDNPIPISELTEDAGRVTLEGEIIRGEVRELKNGNSKLVSFSITDYTGSVDCKAFLGGSRNGGGDPADVKKQVEAVEAYLQSGAWVKLRGEYQYDEFQREYTLRVKDMTRAKTPERKDNAAQKRVELHLHTQMSAMDACASASDLIARAASWGHKAIAITDHGVVQAFPEAFAAAKKHKIKLIPGCEGYLIDDCAQIVDNADGRSLDECAYVVFDVETTGLNKATDDIIEIGAVRIERGREVSEFSTLIDPMRPIPEEITKLTGINDSMVREMPTISKAILEFARFAEGAVLVAHNSSFDMAFLSRAYEGAGLECGHPVVDTLALSRNQLPKLRGHKLGSLCKHYKIKLDKAHRAVHDARATSKVLSLMLGEAAHQHGVSRLHELNEIYSGNAGGTANHIILLAASQRGISNLYRLISEAHLHHFHRTPRMPRSLIQQWREGLILGSACDAGELFRAAVRGADDAELKRIASFYDYLEIQPVGNNEFMVREGTVPNEDALRAINQRIVSLADELDIPCVATGDVHYMDSKDQTYRAILMAAKGFENADDQPPLHFKTTEEMLHEFSYLGEQTAKRVVIDAPNEIAERVGDVRVFIPHPEGKETFQPYWPEAEDDIRNLSEARARAIYGDEMPQIVRARLDKELKSIIGYGFSTLYDVAVKLAKKSLDDGYVVGSRGSVGSSFVAFLTGITEVNSLPPHYICPDCKRCEFDVPEEFTVGLDLPPKRCACGSNMDRDGFDIPFEVFLGFEGDKVPDIDLNFSGEYQQRAHQYVKELFGEKNVFRAGTIGTVAEKTAYGYVLKYLEERGRTASGAEKERLAKGMTGVKRTTGQHPAGMVVLPDGYEIYDFTPIQRPADDMDSETVTTHFDFNSMHDVLVKVDVLGHDDPTMLKKLQDLTGIAPQNVPFDDPEVYRAILSLFCGSEALGVTEEDINTPTGTLGIPEFGTKFVRQMLVDTRPTSMEELIRISGLSHGTDVWLGNAAELIRAKTATLKECICTRDDIMNQLIKLGVPNKIAFDTMESVRKGKGLKQEMEKAMEQSDTPRWFIDSCKKIKYMFPKSHAVAYVIMALRIAYFKIYYPTEYYACFLKRNADAFDATRMIASLPAIRARLEEYEQMDDKAAKKEDEAALLEVIVEMMCRGVGLLPVSLYESDPVEFLVRPGNAILPPLTSIPGLGASAAEVIKRAREEGAFISEEDMVRRRVPKSVVEMLRLNGCLEAIPQTSQISLFDL